MRMKRTGKISDRKELKEFSHVQKKTQGLSLIIFFVYTLKCSAGIQLPEVFGSNMVIQSGRSFCIWGQADPCKTVHINVSWQGKSAAVAVEKSGQWKTVFAPPGTSGPHRIEISADKSLIIFENIWCGEVWLACGQSNMEMPVGNIIPKVYEGVLDYQQEIAEANYPLIKFFTPKYKKTYMPPTEYDGKWVNCSPETVKTFSAVGYFFARRLQRDLKVPTGIINCSWGATKIELWIPEKQILGCPEFSSALNEPRKYPHLYKTLIEPLAPFSIRGAIYYQGESNVGNAFQYDKLMSKLINGWRSEWGQGDFPFYYVQIAPCANFYKSGSSTLLRDAQRMAMSIPNTGMVVTTDIAEPCAPSPHNIHPMNKQEVGRRLALWALNRTYRKNVACSGPIYKKMKTEDDKIRVYFDSTDGGLKAISESLAGFTIAGQDKNFVEAQAAIEGNTVIVFGSKVSRPIAVRFGWTDTPMPNIFNEAGLPASPFRTDDWPQ